MATMALKQRDIPKFLLEKPIGKLSKGDLRLLGDLQEVKEVIQEGFVRLAKVSSQIQEQKVTLGFCGGFLNCMRRPQKGSKVCSDCKEQKANPKRHNHQSQYGQIRAYERKKKAGDR